MFHIFRWHRDDRTRPSPDRLRGQQYKNHHSRLIRGRQSLVNLLHIRRHLSSIDLDRHQVRINSFVIRSTKQKLSDAWFNSKISYLRRMPLDRQKKKR